MKTVVINKQVEKKLKEDFGLFCCWVLFAGIYDHDIHPFHNPDWKKSQSKKEEDLFQTLEEKIEELKKMWNKFQDGKLND